MADVALPNGEGIRQGADPAPEVDGVTVQDITKVGCEDGPIPPGRFVPGYKNFDAVLTTPVLGG